MFLLSGWAQCSGLVYVSLSVQHVRLDETALLISDLEQVQLDFILHEVNALAPLTAMQVVSSNVKWNLSCTKCDLKT